MKKTIVVVDDFDNTRWIIAFTLQKTNAEILQAKNGVEAMKYFDGRDIDLLVTDLNMPQMDGIELVKNVRKTQNYEFLPIIMLTTERSEEKKKKAEEVKVTVWVKKPFEAESFLKIVNRCLNQSRR